jgi:putative transposase
VAEKEEAVLLVFEAQQMGCRLREACLCLGISLRTMQRWGLNPDHDKRRGPLTSPHNKLSEIEIEKILKVANSAEFRDKSPTQIVPLLADSGTYVGSESSFYRILKANHQLTHRGHSKPKERSRPKELIADGPNQVWSWDITFLYTNIAGIYFYLYLVLDVYSRKIVGFYLDERQSSELAADMIEAICGLEMVKPEELTLHSDNGTPMKGATMLATLQRLGIVPSFSRPSVSDDNPYSEALFKTLKYCPQYPSKPFVSLATAKEWVDKFVGWYNHEHLHSGINFVTPASRHCGADKAILKYREAVYKKARQRHPERWSGEVRDWTSVELVVLNPLHNIGNSDIRKLA